jgi:hypothetical protein
VLRMIMLTDIWLCYEVEVVSGLLYTAAQHLHHIMNAPSSHASHVPAGPASQ